MIRREDQKGDTVTFNHTMAGTITSRDYRTSSCRIGWAANSPSGTIADSDTFTFDNLGRMLTAVSGRYTNTVTMTYDSYGRLKDESLTLASQTYTVTRAYDTRSRLTQLTYPNGSIVQRTYTTRSQLHTVKYLGTTVDTRTYDDGGRLGTSTYANAAVVSFAYRNDNLPTSIATTHAGSPNIGTYSYTWDANKNKTGETITSTMSGFGFSTGATGYDDEDRLQTWNRTNGTMNQAWTLSDVGNWDAFTSAGSTWNRTHSNAHEFTGFTGASTGTLTYDVKGNQTSRPSTLSAPALNLDWNFDNQLVGADTNGSAGQIWGHTTLQSLELLDWTARQIRTDKRGATPASAAPLFERLGIDASAWCELTKNFGRLFSSVAGKPTVIDGTRSRTRGQRYNIPAKTRQLLPS